MEKRFDTWAKTMKYIELDIEGSFGRNQTYVGFSDYNKGIAYNVYGRKKKDYSFYFLVMDEWTTLLVDYEGAIEYSVRFYKEKGDNCRYAYKVSKCNGKFKVEVCPVPIID